MKSGQTECEEIRILTDQEQAKIIADRFSAVSNEYDPIDTGRLNTPCDQEGSAPIFSPLQVLNHLLKLKNKKSTAPDDIPEIIIKEFSKFLCVPLSDERD